MGSLCTIASNSGGIPSPPDSQFGVWVGTSFTDQVLNVEEVLAHWIVQVLDGHATVTRLIGPLFAWST